MILRRIALFTVLLFIAGCVPGITVSRKDAKITDDQPLVEYRFGTTVETDEGAVLKDNACKDLAYATEGIAGDVRRDIIKYACVEHHRVVLGETLEKLTPGELERICTRLTETGYTATVDKLPNNWQSFGMGFLVLVFMIVVIQ
jgi:hypothetical protein